MIARVLGSAAGGGVPQWNCGCANCRAAREGDAPRRLVASLAVSNGDGAWLLINASCDIRQQLLLYPDLRPRSLRATPFCAVLLTDANIDHAAGLLEFRQADELQVCSSSVVKETLCANPMFRQFDRERKMWKTFDAAGGFAPLSFPQMPELRVEALVVPGILPSYAGARAIAGAAAAYVFEQHGSRLVYAPIFQTMSNALLDAVRTADAVFLDGTCWTDTEMSQLGLGTRTSREMGHAPISGPDGSLERVRAARPQHKYYTHVNNTNPILDPQSLASMQLQHSGFAVAYDGLEIVLDATQGQDEPNRIDGF